jgi:hypothetical protein
MYCNGTARNSGWQLCAFLKTQHSSLCSLHGTCPCRHLLLMPHMLYCCRPPQIVLHPRWGSAVYPATLFTKAPLQQLLDAVKETEAMLQGTGLSQP